MGRMVRRLKSGVVVLCEVMGIGEREERIGWNIVDYQGLTEFVSEFVSEFVPGGLVGSAGAVRVFCRALPETRRLGLSGDCPRCCALRMRITASSTSTGYLSKSGFDGSF